MSSSSSSVISLPALLASDERPSFCYDLELPPTRDPLAPLKVLVIGCAGTGKPEQKQVAQAMMEYAKEHPVDMVLFLGDNIYTEGVDSPYDPKFKSQFEDIYRQEGSSLKNLPWFTVLGNHDVAKHKTPTNLLLSGDAVGNLSKGDYQVQRTFVHHKNKVGSNTPCNKQIEKFAMAAQGKSKLLLGKHPGKDAGVRGWVMPNQYYRLNIGEQVFLCLDSNTFARDYRLYEENPEGSHRKNQYVWLCQQLDSLHSKEVFLVMHHGLVTAGKRVLARKYDTRLYLNKTHQAYFNDKGVGGHNDILKYIFIEKIKLQMYCAQLTVINAHDHHLMRYICKEFIQIGPGGGGGELQKFYADLGFFQRVNLGYVVMDLVIDPFACFLLNGVNPSYSKIAFHLVINGKNDPYEYLLSPKFHKEVKPTPSSFFGPSEGAYPASGNDRPRVSAGLYISSSSVLPSDDVSKSSSPRLSFRLSRKPNSD